MYLTYPSQREEILRLMKYRQQYMNVIYTNGVIQIFQFIITIPFAIYNFEYFSNVLTGFQVLSLYFHLLYQVVAFFYNYVCLFGNSSAYIIIFSIMSALYCAATFVEFILYAKNDTGVCLKNFGPLMCYSENDQNFMVVFVMLTFANLLLVVTSLGGATHFVSTIYLKIEKGSYCELQKIFKKVKNGRNVIGQTIHKTNSNSSASVLENETFKATLETRKSATAQVCDNGNIRLRIGESSKNEGYCNDDYTTGVDNGNYKNTLKFQKKSNSNSNSGKAPASN